MATQTKKLKKFTMKTIATITLLLFAFTAFASQKAITDKGDVVILKDNGKWFYEDKSKNKVKTTTNKKKFKKSSKANFELKSTVTDISIFLNPKKWSFEKEADGESAEYSFENKAGNVYGKLITENLQMTLEQLVNIALINAKNFAPDTQITKKEYRIVNGNKVIYLEMEGSSDGLEFTYFGYYFSNKAGLNQLVTYSISNVVNKKIRKEVETFLNGLSTRQTKQVDEDNT